MNGEKAGTAPETGNPSDISRKRDAPGLNRRTILLALLGLVAVVFIASLALSFPSVHKAPHIDAAISYDSASHTVIFTHNGGDPLPGTARSLSVTDAAGVLIPNTSPLVVYNGDGSVDSAGTWSLGKSIRYTLDTSAGTPSGAQVMYMGPPSSVISSTRFTPVFITPPTLPVSSPFATNPIIANTTVHASQEHAINVTARISTIAVTQGGTDTPVTISYTTDTAGSGSQSAPFTLSRGDPANSSFGGILTAPLQDCNGSFCTVSPRYFSHWSVNGVIYPEPAVDFAVTDNASWTATAVYSDSPPCHCLGGKIWEDYSMDGVVDTGEPALAGWTVSLYRQEEKTEVFAGSTTTGADGTYLFLDIPYSGMYTIREGLRNGWAQSHPLKGLYENETLNSASRCRATDLNFGNREILVANFSGVPLSGPAPLTVSFRDLSTGTPQSWSWNFGDGYASSQRDPVYTYMMPGTYGVSLSAASPYGQGHQIHKAGYIAVTPPVATVDLLLDADRGGYIAAGGVMQFRVTGSNSVVQVGSTRYPLGSTDIVRIAVRSDSTGGMFINSASSLTSFSLPDVDLYINGDLKKTGAVSDIYISSLDQFSSSLQLILPAKGGEIHLTAGGVAIAPGTNGTSLVIRNLRPDMTFHSMSLDANADRVKFNGGAAAYSLT